MGKGKYFGTFLFLLFCPLLVKSIIIESTNVPRFLIASIFLLVAFIIVMVKKIDLVFPKPLIWTLFVAFYFINLSSSFWSLNIADALYESQKIFIGLCSLILFITLLKKSNEETDIVKQIVIASLVFTLYNIVELAEFDFSNSSFNNENITLSIHKNILSSLLFLMLPFSLYSAANNKGVWRWISIITALLILVIIGVLQTRAVYLALIGSVGAFLLFFQMTKWRKQVNKIIVLSLAVLSLTAVLFVFQKNVINHDTKASSNSMASVHERYLLWNKSLKMIEENPILGVGAGNWKYNYSKFSVEDIDRSNFYNTVFKRPHNDFLAVLTESGIVGALILIALILIIIDKTLLKMIEKKDKKGLLIFSALIGLMIISFFSFPKERITHIIFATLLIAMLLNNNSLVISFPKRFKNTMGTFILLGLGFNMLIATFRLGGEYYTKKIFQAQEDMNPRAVIDYGNKALSPFYNVDPTSTPIYSYIGWGYNSFGELDSLSMMSRRAVELCPFDYKMLSNYGYILNRQYQLERASIVLSESRRINPNYEPTILNLSVLEYNRGNYLKALFWLQSIKDYDIKYPSNVRRIMEKLE